MSTSEEDVNANTVGEAFTGFRQWLKRYFQLETGTNTRFTVYQAQKGKQALGGDLRREVDVFYKVSLLYRFMSGSMRVLAVRSDGYRVSEEAMSTDIPLDVFASGETIVETTSSEPLMEYTIPFYQKFPALLTDSGTPHFSEPEEHPPGLAYTELPHNLGTQIAFSSGFVNNGRLYQAIGEDFSFGYLIGVPLTFIVVEKK
jgi:hypothetical protein